MVSARLRRRSVPDRARRHCRDVRGTGRGSASPAASPTSRRDENHRRADRRARHAGRPCDRARRVAAGRESPPRRRPPRRRSRERHRDRGGGVCRRGDRSEVGGDGSSSVVGGPRHDHGLGPRPHLWPTSWAHWGSEASSESASAQSLRRTPSSSPCRRVTSSLACPTSTRLGSSRITLAAGAPVRRPIRGRRAPLPSGFLGMPRVLRPAERRMLGVRGRLRPRPQLAVHRDDAGTAALARRRARGDHGAPLDHRERPDPSWTFLRSRVAVDSPPDAQSRASRATLPSLWRARGRGSVPLVRRGVSALAEEAGPLPPWTRRSRGSRPPSHLSSAS